MENEITWENTSSTLLENLSKSQQIIEKCLHNYAALKQEAMTKDSQIQSQDVQQVQNLSDKLQSYLSSIFAVDNVIFAMFKMVKISKVVCQWVSKSMSERQKQEMVRCLDALQLYLLSAIGYIQCVFGDYNL